MAQRRFGPTRGAGVAIIELEGEKGITPGALGFAGYAGVLEKGPVGELIIATNQKQFEKKCGGIISASLLPDAAFDYYSLANGAGGLLLVRVTDGNEAQAEMPLYARNASVLTQMGTLKAKNGGRWGGKEKRYSGEMAVVATDLTNTTLDTGVATFKTDEWVGGYIELPDVPNVRYPIVGNTAAGVITVAADQTMKDTYDGLSGADDRYYLVLENEDKALSVIIGDGEEDPSGEFSLSVYVDGDFVKKYPNLNTDPTDANYWVKVINDDTGNDEITAVDLWTGAHVPGVRPANVYGLIAAGLSDTVLPAVIHDFAVTLSPTGANPTVALDATDDDMVAQQLTLTMADATTFNVVSDKFGALGVGTVGVSFVADIKWVPEFTVSNGATVLATGDTMRLNYKPLKPDALIGGYVYPDKVNAKSTKFRIVDNDHDSITAADGSTMLTDGAPGDQFLVEAPLEMEGGRDGYADLVDADYNQQAWDVGNSPFNRTFGKNYGLIKFATPGINATAVQKAGVAYADAKNHQYRYEFPANITTESAAIDYVNDTLGRSDYAVAAFPSYGDVADPSGGPLTKQVVNTGMIHGREARIAADYDGYHKAGAGLDATLPALLDVTTGDALLNEELLNPVGIAVVKKLKGNYVVWGDRTLNTDPNWKWKHQREQMSYYEHVLQESFDWVVFMINDPTTEKLALASLQSYFLPEFTKRALRGETFQDAAIIKLDEELNTNATRAAGDMIAEIKLRLADTVERFIIRIGKQGIFESVG